jgi:hypothetical protein
MNFWDGKCFNCIIIGTLVAIIGLTVRDIKKENKKTKHKVEQKRSSFQESM